MHASLLNNQNIAHSYSTRTVLPSPRPLPINPGQSSPPLHPPPNIGPLPPPTQSNPPLQPPPNPPRPRPLPRPQPLHGPRQIPNTRHKNLRIRLIRLRRRGLHVPLSISQISIGQSLQYPPNLSRLTGVYRHRRGIHCCVQIAKRHWRRPAIKSVPRPTPPNVPPGSKNNIFFLKLIYLFFFQFSKFGCHGKQGL